MMTGARRRDIDLAAGRTPFAPATRMRRKHGRERRESSGVDAARAHGRRAPVRSITVAPALCAAGQLRSASAALPAKNTKRAPSKLSSSSARIKVGSPAASVRVPASTLSSSRTISLGGKIAVFENLLQFFAEKRGSAHDGDAMRVPGPEGMVRRGAKRGGGERCARTERRRRGRV